MIKDDSEVNKYGGAHDQYVNKWCVLSQFFNIFALEMLLLDLYWTNHYSQHFLCFFLHFHLKSKSAPRRNIGAQHANSIMDRPTAGRIKDSVTVYSRWRMIFLCLSTLFLNLNLVALKNCCILSRGGRQPSEGCSCLLRVRHKKTFITKMPKNCL